MVKINMGCGWRNFGEGWIHIDGGDYEHLDYKSITDLSQFDDNSVDLIYASHVIEYFDRQEVLELLKEWNRVLKKGGILRIAVPNFEIMSRLYNENIIKLDKIIGPLYGRMKMEDVYIYHKTVYDFLSLSNILEKCEFYNVKKYDWKQTEHSQFDDHSQAYIPHLDKKNGILISLNVEAVK